MTPFTRLTSIAVPFAGDHVDTDVIFPARFLLLMEREGMGQYLFHDRRFGADGQAAAGSPLDDPHYAGAQILLAGADFGCGSSREQAVWALEDFGIRCILAESFGEIFAANCLRNGILTIALPRDILERIGAQSGPCTIDLIDRSIMVGGELVGFEIAPESRERLIAGRDEIEHILARFGPGLTRFEAQQQRTQPWLWTKR